MPILASALYESGSVVAQGNPHAWSRDPVSAEQIWQSGPANRMISWPYTKLMNSNNMVDQGAALILTSVEKATSLQIPTEGWVFPYAGTDAHDTYLIGERAELHTSPAIRIAGARVLELSGMGVADMHLVDVYSCFPSAVQIAARELGLPIGAPLYAPKPRSMNYGRPTNTRRDAQLRQNETGVDGRTAGDPRATRRRVHRPRK
jgi:acetyl-CoA C-acetyltransferase